MSHENVEVVRRIYGAWNYGDTSTPIDLFDEEAELRLNFTMGTYQGRDGVRQFVADLMADWTKLWMTVIETLAHEDHVVMIVREDGVGRSSGVPVSSTETHVWTVRQGRAFRAHAYASRAKPSKPWGCGNS